MTKHGFTGYSYGYHIYFQNHTHAPVKVIKKFDSNLKKIATHAFIQSQQGHAQILHEFVSVLMKTVIIVDETSQEHKIEDETSQEHKIGLSLQIVNA